MGKIIRINKCGECPYWQCGWVDIPEENDSTDVVFYDGICTKLRRNVSNIHTILEKCPLDDLKEIEKFMREAMSREELEKSDRKYRQELSKINPHQIINKCEKNEG